MDNPIDFVPNSEEERQYFEIHSGISKATSKMLRYLPKENRFPALKEATPSDVSLFALYLWSVRQEDYETSEVAKKLIEERGFTIPNR